MSDLKITEESAFIEFDVIARPKSSNDSIYGTHNGAIRIGIKSAPEKGKANKSIVKFLSKKLKIPQSDITIVAGETSRNKKVRINGISKKIFLETIGDEIT
ncbi:MAG TPA: DUF167 domain-containing protein [bacterium]|jgi:hypothetical protein